MTPKLKIEEEYWYISYDDGKTWTKLDKATGDGIQIEMDENYVYFILPDGTKITVPTVKPFDMTLSGAEPQSFTIDIKARDGQQNYYVGVTTRTEFEKLESPAAVAEAFIQLEEQNGQVDWSVADGQLVHKGDKSIEAGAVWNLKPKTEYAVMVFGVTAEGALATDPVYGFIATTEVQPSTNRISITVEPGTALKLVERIENAIFSLETMPYRCPERRRGAYAYRGYRQLLVENYTVIYRIQESEKQVIVVTVRYSSSEF